MRRTVSTSLLLLIALTFSPACSIFQENQTEEVAITLDKPFQLRVGETGHLGNELQLTFEKLNGDSRCPLDVVCIWEGEIDAAFRVTTTSESEAVPFKGFVGVDVVLQQVIGSYGIEMRRLDPYPGAPVVLGEAEVRAMLVVNRIGIR